MKPNDILQISTKNITVSALKNSSLNKLSKSFAEEKRSVEIMHSVRDEHDQPAPYYDELHFADYE